MDDIWVDNIGEGSEYSNKLRLTLLSFGVVSLADIGENFELIVFAFVWVNEWFLS